MGRWKQLRLRARLFLSEERWVMPSPEGRAAALISVRGHLQNTHPIHSPEASASDCLPVLSPSAQSFSGKGP